MKFCKSGLNNPGQNYPGQIDQLMIQKSTWPLIRDPLVPGTLGVLLNSTPASAEARAGLTWL